MYNKSGIFKLGLKTGTISDHRYISSSGYDRKRAGD